MSGSIPSRWHPNHRAEPAEAEYRPRRRSAARRARGTAPARPPSSPPAGAGSPPAPITGSPMNAAISPARSSKQRAERVGVVVRHAGHVGDQRAEALAVGGDPGQARAVGVHAVVAVLAVDDQPLVGLPERVPVPARQLRRGVDRVRAAASRRTRRASGNGASAETRSASSSAGRLASRSNVSKRRQLAHLRRGRVGDLGRARGPTAAYQSAGAGVDVLAPVRVPHPGAAAASRSRPRRP